MVQDVLPFFGETCYHPKLTRRPKVGVPYPRFRPHFRPHFGNGMATCRWQQTNFRRIVQALVGCRCAFKIGMLIPRMYEKVFWFEVFRISVRDVKTATAEQGCRPERPSDPKKNNNNRSLLSRCQIEIVSCG